MTIYDHFYSGSQNPEDIDVLVKVLGRYTGRPCRVLETGVLTGQTARGMKFICDTQATELDYWGIDPVSPETHDRPRIPFPGAHFVQADSAEAAHLVPSEFDVVLLDGCHCGNHVILETFLYGSRVVPGGFLLFHDTNPFIQRTMKDPHGPNQDWFHNSVLDAQKLIGFPFHPWKLFMENDPVPGRSWGGITAYRKME